MKAITKKNYTTIIFVVCFVLYASYALCAAGGAEEIFGDTMTKADDVKDYMLTKVAALLATLSWFGFFIAMLFGKAEKANFARVTGACFGLASVGAIVDFFIG